MLLEHNSFHSGVSFKSNVTLKLLAKQHYKLNRTKLSLFLSAFLVFHL